MAHWPSGAGPAAHFAPAVQCAMPLGSPLTQTLGVTNTRMKYDDASWHHGGTFPAGKPYEHGGTHIGLFLRWCFEKGWAGQLHMDDEPDHVAEVIHGNMSGTDFLFKYCDGKFIDEDLNSEGNAFAAQYYGDDGLYLDDYAEVFGDLMYLEPERAHEYERLATILEARLASGILTKSQLKA
jgi:hypothetical protein